MSYRRVQKKKKTTNYRITVWSLVTVRNQSPAQAVKLAEIARHAPNIVIVPPTCIIIIVNDTRRLKKNLDVCRKYACSKRRWRIFRRGWPGPRRSRAAGRIRATRTRRRNCWSSWRNSANDSCPFRGASSTRTIRRASSPRAASSFLMLCWRNSKISTPGELSFRERSLSQFIALTTSSFLNLSC